MLRIAIVENERAKAERLRGYIAQYAQERGEECRVVAFADAAEFLRQYSFDCDVAILDTALPACGGLEAARALRAIDECVGLILTAKDVAFALDGYAVRAAAYLVEPVCPAEFFRAMDRAARRAALALRGEIFIPSGGVCRRIPAARVRYIEACGRCLVYHLLDGTVTAAGRLSSVEDALGVGFYRCSAAHMVNLRYVTAFVGGRVCLGDVDLPVSRRRKPGLLRRLRAG